MDVIKRIELQQGCKGIQHELRVARCVYTDAAAAFEVDNFQYSVAHDDEVAGAKALRHILGVVQAVFYQDERVGAGGTDGLDDLNAKLHIFIGDGLGLIRIEVAVLVLLVLGIQYIRGHVPQIAMELQLAKLMKKRAFLGIYRGLIRELVAPIFEMSYHNLNEEEIADISLTLARVGYTAARQGVNIFSGLKTTVLPIEATQPYEIIAGAKGHVVDKEANREAMMKFLFSEDD